MASKLDELPNIDDLRISNKQAGYALIRYDDGPVHSYPYDAPWLDDEEFNALYEMIRHNTLVDRTRCYALYLLMAQVKKIPGDILEVGTWRGGTAGMFTRLAKDKTVYLADTFEGVVKASKWEHYKDHAHADTSEQLVVDFLHKDLGVTNFKVLKGIFPEETGKAITRKKFSLVYLDVDVYRSTKDAFNYVWDSVVPYGIVAFDDYGMISACSGISKFVNEIRDDKDKIFIQNLNGQAYIIKKSK
jgi:O-methyltransferase